MNIKLVETEAELRLCYPVMHQLRQHLSLDEFLTRAARQQKEAGYRIAMLTAAANVKAVAGFRISEGLAWGKYLYVDDLVTDAASRSAGHGDALFDWLIDFARAEHCQSFHLDSGVQRFEAHRFYLRKRMQIASHHFSISL